MRITTPAIREFDHRPHPAVAVLMAFCCAGGIAIGGFLAAYPPAKGIRSELRGIALSQTQTRWLGIVLLVASPISVIVAIGLIRISFLSRRRVAITEGSLIVPKPSRTGVSLDEIEIPLDAITGLSLDDHTTGGRGLWIIHTGGRVFLAANMFRSRREFDAMARAVMKAAGQDDDTPDGVE